jgi:hypothetical protein
MSPADVIAYQWVTNECHPRHMAGLEGATFPGLPYPNDRWGLDQIWHLRNGQRVIARKKPRY